MKTQIHTATDLLKASAKALKNKDTDELYHLLDVLDTWAIDEEKFKAYEAVLIAMIEAIDQGDDE